MKIKIEKKLLSIARKKLAKAKEEYAIYKMGPCNSVYLTPIEILLLKKHDKLVSADKFTDDLVKDLIKAGKADIIRYEFVSEEKNAYDKSEEARILKLLDKAFKR